MTLGIPLLLAGAALGAASSAPPPHDAQAIVRQAIDAEGGAAALRAMAIVRLHEMVRREALEQSIRPEGPYFENYSDTIETRRFATPALRTEARSRGYSSDWWIRAEWAKSTALATGGAALVLHAGAMVPTSQDAADEAEASLALGPERALLTAEAAPDLTLDPPAMLHGYAHEVLSFHWQGAPVRIFIEPISHMPTAVEITRSRPMNVFWAPWGDVATRVEWEGWTAEPNGVRYPRRWLVTSNGRVERSVMIDQIDINPEVAAGALDAPAALIAKARAARRPIEALPFPAGKGEAIASGVTQFRGAWNTIEVSVPGGVYIVEGPISNLYSKGAIAHARSGGRKLLGVITTSDSWPHIGGLREYVAQGVPVIALDLNQPILKRLFDSPHMQTPDDLARNPRRPVLELVDAPRTIGSGASAMRLIPLRTVSGERQMAIYWPAQRLLYTSDIMAVQPDGLWLPEYRDEIADVIAREKLNVETVFGMHYAPTQWAMVRTMSAPSPQIAS
jgi:hypothetical protein